MRKLKKILKWILIAFIGFVVLAVLIGSSNKDAKKSFEAGRNDAIQEDKQYERLNYEDVGNVENLDILFKGDDKSKENIEKVAREIKKDQCKKPCNISIFDDKQALELDLAYRKLTSGAEMDAWKQKNYIFVADHLLGYLEFEGEGIFFYYPHKDWYYKELKAKQN